MPFLKTVVRTAGTALGAVALLAVPAHAADCTPAGQLSQPFAPFGDLGLYTPVENAGLESGSEGWTLRGDAAVTDGNEPWIISGNADDDHALDLPAGSSATTARICIDETYNHLRLFARNAGRVGGELRIEVLAFDAKGRPDGSKPFDYEGGGEWAPTGAVPIDVLDERSPAPVAFRFTAKGAEYLIDDVYVDPWARS